MTRKLIIITGAILFLAVNALFLLVVAVVGIIRERVEGKGKESKAK